MPLEQLHAQTVLRYVLRDGDRLTTDLACQPLPIPQIRETR